MKYWETKDGKLIEYGLIKDSHLLNIIKFLRKRSEDGIDVISTFYDGDDDFQTGDVETVYGKYALRLTDYRFLLYEAKKRGLKVK